MTSYSVERPTRTRGPAVRPGLVHLSAREVTTGQPVTIRTLNEDGREVEFPAVYVRRDGYHLRCAKVGENDSRRYPPSQVFPRHVIYRRWAVTLKHKAVADDGGEDGLYELYVPARTELEARFQALKTVRALHGEQASYSFTLHSVTREG